MELLSRLSDFLINGFIISVILLFVGYIFLIAYRPVLNKLIVISNLLLIVGASFFLIVSIRQLFTYSDNSEGWEQYALTSRFFGHYWFVYSGPVLFKGLLPQLLWIRKIQQSNWVSILFIPFLLIDYYLPAFYPQTHSYLPSSWTMQPNYPGMMLTVIIYFLLLIAVYWLTRKKLTNS